MFLRLFKRTPKSLGEVRGGDETEASKADLTGINMGDYNEVERYPLVYPWAYAVILENRASKAKVYYVSEVPLNSVERGVYERLLRILEWELKPYGGSVLDYVKEKEFFVEQARRIVRIYSAKLSDTLGPNISWQKVLYYVLRDTVGYGPLEPLMRDQFIEDISCDGVRRPIYVWHQRYESMPTNIVFEDEGELDSLILRLAHKAGKHISSAFPVLDAILPEGHRLAATFRREVSVGGSTFTIRKFRERPLSITDLIAHGTLSSTVAAYLWMAMEYKMPGVVIGVTGSGKTTMLNALATLLRPNMKVVTIEDTPELRLTLENWVQLVSRPSYAVTGSKIGEVTLYDLVKVSLRYRPDVIIVGEIRGEEAYVLFQAIATGHGGLTTAHAESVGALVKRLTSPPMNVPQSYIPLMKWALLVKRVTKIVEGRPVTVRRATTIWEIKGYENYALLATWDPVGDKHKVNLNDSMILWEVSQSIGLAYEGVVEEVKRRSRVLEALVDRGVRDYRGVAEYIYRYYVDPRGILEELGVGGATDG